MSLFSSNREKCLWLWTLAVVIAIYSTLGLARKLAGTLRDEGLLAGLFIFCLVLIGAAGIFMAFKKRRGVLEFGVLFGVAAVYLLVFARMAIPEERSHLIEYSVVALFILEALKERKSQGRPVLNPAMLAIFLTACIGTLDECIQAILPSRVSDPIDILFNFLAALMAVGGSLAVQWAKGRVTL